MGKPQRRFGKEFEAEAVRLVEVSGRTQREIAMDLGVGALRIIAQSASASEHKNSSSAQAMMSDSSSSLIDVPDSDAAASLRARLSSSSGTASRAISSTNSLNGSLMD